MRDNKRVRIILKDDANGLTIDFGGWLDEHELKTLRKAKGGKNWRVESIEIETHMVASTERVYG